MIELKIYGVGCKEKKRMGIDVDARAWHMLEGAALEGPKRSTLHMKPSLRSTEDGVLRPQIQEKVYMHRFTVNRDT